MSVDIYHLVDKCEHVRWLNGGRFIGMQFHCNGSATIPQTHMLLYEL